MQRVRSLNGSRKSSSPKIWLTSQPNQSWVQQALAHKTPMGSWPCWLIPPGAMLPEPSRESGSVLWSRGCERLAARISFGKPSRRAEKLLSKCIAILVRKSISIPIPKSITHAFIMFLKSYINAPPSRYLNPSSTPTPQKLLKSYKPSHYLYFVCLKCTFIIPS